ncbi:DROUGHT SENSITIVE 1 [Raphanus sativus]|uniref:Uncharacterized protein LOC108824461 n=1 Tax=Raphanus sativus TaxID=3726 RepID=A0A6J0L165_RAPSA|nr:uncharacterized protein LOC108824461 [Raphanus sativus]KAJ4874367.1 DROUGHT SENSITIVE 1 [Raphanus sativus]
MTTELERKRLENMRRNDEMMAALNIRAKASLLTAAATKRTRDKKEKQRKPVAVVGMRKSLRTRGLNPDSVGLPYYKSSSPPQESPLDRFPQKSSSDRLLAPLPFDTAAYYYRGGGGEGSHKHFVETMLGFASKSRSDDHYYLNKEEASGGVMTETSSIEFEGGGFDTGGPLSLEPHNVAHLVPATISVLNFMPCDNVKLVAAGDRLGYVSFWNLDSEDEESDGIYLFQPHTAPISSLVFHQNSFSKMFSSSDDGLIRLMDAEKSVFDLVYSSNDAICSLSQRPNDEQSLYFSKGYGKFNVGDLRAGKSFSYWGLHGDRINTIDFNPQNPHVMATSSKDGTARLWDLRSMGPTTKPKTLRTLTHSKNVHSAYFSPTGLSLATTSADNYIGILSGATFEDTSMIYHDNCNTINQWNSTSRGVWGWDDSYIFVGNRLSKRIDVISTKLKRTVKELHDPLMKTIPCRIHCHPLNVGVLAGSTAGGHVYVWTPK